MKPAPFSPVLLAGMLVRPLPLFPIEIAIRNVAKKIQHNHPSVMERLQPISGTVFLINPTDLPFNIIMKIGDDEVEVHCTRDKTAADVYINGDLLSLIKMLDGEVDGDALFFSRDLVVEGDTEALVTLRNALDGDEIDIINEILPSSGICHSPIQKSLSGITSLFSRVEKDLNIIKTAITSSVVNRCEVYEAESADIKNKIVSIEKRLTKCERRVLSS